MTVAALDPEDPRQADVAVAGPAALLVAKLHKLAERRDTPARLIDKDAHDIYRLLVATDTGDVARKLSFLCHDDLAGTASRVALGYLRDLFGAGPGSLGAVMAGRAEELVGDPATVSAAVAALASGRPPVACRGRFLSFTTIPGDPLGCRTTRQNDDQHASDISAYRHLGCAVDPLIRVSSDRWYCPRLWDVPASVDLRVKPISTDALPLSCLVDRGREHRAARSSAGP